MGVLLEKAKNFNPKVTRREIILTQDELELFIALAKGEITMSQAGNALKYQHNGTIYVNMTKAFIQLTQRGLIEFKPFEESKKLTKKISCKICNLDMIVLENEERDFCSTQCYDKFQEKLKEAREILYKGMDDFIISKYKSSEKK